MEWADESEKDQINVAVQRETMTMVRVHELPSDSQLTFRLTAKVYTGPPDQGGEVFAEATFSLLIDVDVGPLLFYL